MPKLIIFLLIVLPLQLGVVLAQDSPSKSPSLNSVKADAMNGNVQAMNLIGNLYKSGNGASFDPSLKSPDYIEAKKWFEMAAAKGYAPAIFNLGTLFEQGGFGLEKDLNKARQYYQSAVKAGFSRAQVWLDNLEKSNPAPSAVVGAKPGDAKNVSKTPARQSTSLGSGFFVNTENVVTNNHVVSDCSAINVNGFPARLVARDGRADLAVLRTTVKPVSTVQFSASKVSVGEAVAVAGFPLQGLLSSFNMTTGIVSSLTGVKGDSRVAQITAPVQNGNSGGPVLDTKGNLVGVVVSGLDPMVVDNQLLAPQNVNFAIKSSIVLDFLEANQISFKTVTAGKELNPKQIAQSARTFTVAIECLK
jgi:S1-C subfamily serine protease